MSAPRPVRPQAKAGKPRLESDERRAQLLAFGLATFGSRAYDDVSVDEIARAAGVSRALIFHHFPSKRDFYVATLREAARQLVEALDVPATMDPLARLSEGLRRWLAFAEQHAPAYIALVRGGVGADTAVAEIVEGTRDLVVGRIVHGLGRTAPTALLRNTLRGWVGFVETSSLDWLSHRDVPRKKLIDLWQTSLLLLVPNALGEAE